MGPGLTCERCRKVKELCSEVGDFRQRGLDVLLEVLHGHGGQVEQLIGDLEGTPKVRSVTDVE